MTQIKTILEKLYRKYNHHRLIKPDPLQFVYHYSTPTDMEIVAFLASSLAYGRVQQIEKSMTDLLRRMGNSPFEFTVNFNSKQRKKIKDFKHRFTSGDNIADLLALLKKVFIANGSIEKFFLLGYKKTDRNIIPALSNFCYSLLGMHSQKHNGQPSQGLKYLLTSPANGSACKRINLFLRWMVRNDNIDTGLWKSIVPAKLVVPVDIHMSRLCRLLGLYSQKTASLSAALKITDNFSKIMPPDPVKYDFALSRLGIVQGCTASPGSVCKDCQLHKLCLEIWSRK